MYPEIVWQPLGNRKFASSRFRALLPCKYLKQAGWNCGIFDRKLIDHYKLVIFQKRYDEESIYLAKTLKQKGIKTVLDICDNDFYNPNNHSGPQRIAENLRQMVNCVDFVSASTPELAKLIQDKETFVIDDVVEYPKQSSSIHQLASDFFFKLRTSQSRTNAQQRFNIVWYGNNRSEPANGSTSGLVDAVKLIPILEELNIEIPLSFTVISNSKELFDRYFGKVSFPTRYYEWQENTFSSVFKQHDVCVIPISIDPFTICKTNNRLVLSLLLNVPVIADKIPGYEEFSRFTLFSDWSHHLRLYALNSELRSQHIEAGKQYIASNYGSDRVVSQWSNLFRKVLELN